MEEKKGKVLYIAPIENNGQPEMFNEFYKFTVSFDNGDVGIIYSKSKEIPVAVNSIIEYEKKTGTSSKGPYVTIKLKNNAKQNQNNFKKFGGYNNNISVKCAEISADLCKSENLDAVLSNFTRAYSTVSQLLNHEQKKDDVAPSKQVMDDATMAFLKSLFIKYKNDTTEPEKVMKEIIRLITKYEFPDNIL